MKKYCTYAPFPLVDLEGDFYYFELFDMSSSLFPLNFIISFYYSKNNSFMPIQACRSITGNPSSNEGGRVKSLHVHSLGINT